MKTILQIPGPIIAGKQRFAQITIQKHRTTATVRWDVGGIDLEREPSDLFRDRLEAAGMMRALGNWWAFNCHKFGPRAYSSFSCRWGQVRFVPHADAEDVAEIVRKFYAEAVAGLPES